MYNVCMVICRNARRHNYLCLTVLVLVTDRYEVLIFLWVNVNWKRYSNMRWSVIIFDRGTFLLNVGIVVCVYVLLQEYLWIRISVWLVTCFPTFTITIILFSFLLYIHMRLSNLCVILCWDRKWKKDNHIHILGVVTCPQQSCFYGHTHYTY